LVGVAGVGVKTRVSEGEGVDGGQATLVTVDGVAGDGQIVGGGVPGQTDFGGGQGGGGQGGGD